MFASTYDVIVIDYSSSEDGGAAAVIPFPSVHGFFPEAARSVNEAWNFPNPQIDSLCGESAMTVMQFIQKHSKTIANFGGSNTSVKFHEKMLLANQMFFLEGPLCP